MPSLKIRTFPFLASALLVCRTTHSDPSDAQRTTDMAASTPREGSWIELK
jgi:hypothetical protein